MSVSIVSPFRPGVFVCLLLLGGCASVWVDDEGTRHVVGLVHLTLPAEQAPAAVETLRVRTLGLAWTHADAGSALLLGYGDTMLGFLRNNACVAPEATRKEARDD